MGYKWNKTKDDNECEHLNVFWEMANYLIDWDLPDGDDDHRYKAIIFSNPFIDMSKTVLFMIKRLKVHRLYGLG
ncbi:hypothetical protein L7G72_01775 [Xenorhabdus bovienii]|uniref:hypothetical protein n=1 Tax=Xenorhabdus bovienii TaxID=40576 RepID=UPI001EE08044|nr:hypothetical protein [Xenorhabdus bovienii]MCG3460605.1 hypothetical protein [Xenorhabdus bovienii]